MTAITRNDSISGANAEVNYIWNPPAEPDVTLTFVTEAEEHSTMRTLPGRPVWITNARSLSHRARSRGLRARVARERGRRLRPDPGRRRRRPALHRRDDRTAPGRDGRGQGVHARRWEEAFGESATDKLAPLLNAKPARYPHADNTDASAAGLVDLILPVRRRHRARAVPALTRCTTCGARSRRRRRTSRSRCATRASIAPADEVTVTAIIDRTQRRHRPRHHRVPLQPGPPLALLPRHAARRGPRVQGARHRYPPRRRVPHTAFTDPTCPPGTPTRASVEMRGLALFD